MSIQSENNFTLNDDVNGPVLAAVFATEMILALIANGVVLLITITQRNSWKQSSTIFFTSLILAHLVLNLLYLPFTIIALAAGEWIFGSTDEEKRETCDFVAYTLWYSIPVITITLAAISFDRFLFIVKPHLHKQFMRPWVALTLTLAIWILSAVVTFTPFIKGSGAAFIYEGSHVWTFCFTRKFIHNQSEIAGDNVYASRKKRLFGIFGAMLIVYGLCFTPGIINYAVVRPPQRDRVNYPVSSNNNSSGSKTEINRIGTSTQLTMSLDNALNTEHSSTTVNKENHFKIRVMTLAVPKLVKLKLVTVTVNKCKVYFAIDVNLFPV
uniref:G-protein coupled receptors family 1 profile domain-containing protein n=1 Tax=Amphimedon queenslandica TaxID=400682 RepID=A0A1X7TTT8_AMPQE